MHMGRCCHCGGCTVGFWGLCDQSTWALGIDFPVTWTKLFSRTKDNIAACNVLVVGRYKFTSPFTDEPATTADRDAVADWITAGGVLFVLHEYYGSPSGVPVTPINSLNDFLSYIGAESRPVATPGIAPNNIDFPIGTFSTTGSHDLLTGVDKLWVSAPGHMTVGAATLLFEARKTPSTPYVSILSIESYGTGSIVFCSDASMINNAAAVAAIAADGNKILTLLENLCAISNN